MGHILVVGESDGGHLSEASRELVTKAETLRATWGGQMGLVVIGRVDPEEARGADFLYQTGDDIPYMPTIAEEAIVRAARDADAAWVLMPNTTLGLDTGAAVAYRLGYPFVGYGTALEAEAEGLRVRSQVYGGKLVAETILPLSGGVVTVIPGSWPATRSGDDRSPAERPLPLPEDADKGMELLEVVEAETGDVDIARADILVSVGRGLQGPENLDLAEELAAALGGVVSCSRPVVDAGWMPRSRQVGKSGKTVKPKLYLALGISGAPEHLQGMKDAELIVAVNSDASAPIFDVAHYGAVCDILDFMPALTEKLQERAT
jgi:electron transfer flavoprotein alpha subunit